MNKDVIENLLKESMLETSDDFSVETMRKLDDVLARRMRLRLYFLISAIVLILAGLVFLLISNGFSIQAFGEQINLPRIASMTLITLSGYLVILHLFLLARAGKEVTM